ncbi:MAG TPA: adenylate/guanylate cyclase domain-containing protein [Fimbriimonadaceae bacterium]|nr:adenylate/guanylate cyclase domain-containing protein [Fimbriimonadaceae bacterium]
MRAETTQDAPLEGAQALARHLQQHPAEVDRPAEALAEEFGLTREFVEDVLRGVRQQESGPRRRYGSTGSAHRLWNLVRSAFLWATDRLTLFLIVTAATSVLVSTTLQAVFSGPDGLPIWALRLQWSVTIALWSLQLAALGRHAMVRYAVLAALVNWLIAAPVAMVLRWSTIREQPPDQVVLELLLVASQSFILFAQLGLIASVVAVAGAYVRLRRHERSDAQMSRQELLERLFEIRSKLRGESAQERRMDAREQWVRSFRVHWPLKSFLVGLGFGLVQIAALVLVGALKAETGPTIAGRLLFPVLFATDIVLLALCGFLSGSILKAIAAGWLYQLGTILTMLVPMPGYTTGPQFVIDRFTEPHQFWLLVATTFLAAVLAGLGASVEERWQRIRRLRDEEPAALLAEMVRIQWRLSPQAADVCVMVVDVVRSSDMKASSDPLLVEYSFREYQTFVASVSERFGGEVHSTAGDGVVVSFPRCHEAYEAAQTLQEELAAFNRDTNKLPTPFRVRIGLHVGSVAGELSKVQFTDVIDIAAHVQDAAPPGSIAMTPPVAAQIGLTDLVEAGRTDGHSVLLAPRLAE